MASPSFKTPSSALGLPQTNARRAVSNVHDAYATERRRWLLLTGFFAVVCVLYMVSSYQEFLQARTTHSDDAHPIVVSEQDERKAIEEALSREKEELVNRVVGFHDDKKIVVLISSYRDAASCAQSIEMASDLALLSDRISFRVFEEVHVGREETCVEALCRSNANVCRILRRSGRLQYRVRDASSPLGIAVAKHLVECTASETESDFYLSIGPRIAFTPQWDLELLKQWFSIGNDQAILSVAPKSVRLKDRSDSTMLFHCSARIHSKSSDAVVEFNPPIPMEKPLSPYFSPVLQSQYSELFHFGPVAALFQVRSDPYTPAIIVGHEYSRAARFWTNGYDFYAPTKDILYTSYAKVPAPPAGLWKPQQQEKSYRRIRRLLGLRVTFQGEQVEDERQYGLGDKRTFAQWKSFSGIDPEARYNESTTNQFTICDRSLHYVRPQ